MQSSSAQHIPEQLSEPTFRNYSAKQAKEYDQLRPSYPKNLIKHIITHHELTGGELGCVLDLGCGPGNATRNLAPHFDKAIGIDPSPQMVEVARETGGNARTSGIQYHTGEAETCGAVPVSSVDLITAGTSAHWFDMDKFWPTAARLLKPKGTVAIFVIYRLYCHPSMPHAEEVQRILFKLEHETLRHFTLPGNFMVMENYRSLPMPWDMSPKVEVFDRAASVRKVWNENGKPDGDDDFLSGVQSAPLDVAERWFGTSSAVTRWREANPTLANTEKDCVRAAFVQIANLFEEQNPVISIVGPTTLLLLKKH